MFEAGQYLIERRSFKNRKNESLVIKGIGGNVLGHYGPDENGIVIKDVDGIIQGEVRRLSTARHAARFIETRYVLTVFGPQHELRGTIKQTDTGMSFFILSTPSKWEIMDPQGGLLATLRISESKRLDYIWQFKSPDGELVADVHPSSNKEFIQLDVTRPGFDPLLVLADIIYQIAARGVPLVPM
jgi:hypothetical protein